MTVGLDVFVQLVIAAITTEPSRTRAAGLAASATTERPLTGPPSSDSLETASVSGFGPLPNAAVKLFHNFGSHAPSCGRLGPARLAPALFRALPPQLRDLLP